MRALTLTQPWAGLVAAGVKLVENRPRAVMKRNAIGDRFAIHASRVIDGAVYARIAETAPDLHHHSSTLGSRPTWYQLSRITSAVIAVATLDRVVLEWRDGRIVDAYGTDGGPEVDLGDQRRWFFGPIGYVLRDVRALATPVPCRGWQGFWTLAPEIAASVEVQLKPIGDLIAESSVGRGLANIEENGLDAELKDLEEGP